MLQPHDAGDRRRHHAGVRLQQHPRPPAPRRRRRRPQAGDVQRAELLHHHRRADYVALARRPTPATSSATAPATRSRSTRATPNGPRGAWDDANLRRQQAKIVTAINTLDADIVSLEEIENSVAVRRGPRRRARQARRRPQRRDAGTTRWAFVPSPAAADLPPTAEQDVIRTAFIYNPATVELGRRLARSWSATPRPSPTPASRWPRRSRPRAPATPTRSASSSTTSSPRAPAPHDPATGQGNANADRDRAGQRRWSTSPTRSRPTGASARCS